MIDFAVAREIPAGRVGDGADAPVLPDLATLFHRLNNQLGVILANAELLETRVSNDAERARAAQVVAGTLDAIATVQNLKRALGAGIYPTPLNPSAE
jgi:hypothetical protein